MSSLVSNQGSAIRTNSADMVSADNSLSVAVDVVSAAVDALQAATVAVELDLYSAISIEVENRISADIDLSTRIDNNSADNTSSESFIFGTILQLENNLSVVTHLPTISLEPSLLFG